MQKKSLFTAPVIGLSLVGIIWAGFSFMPSSPAAAPESTLDFSGTPPSPSTSQNTEQADNPPERINIQRDNNPHEPTRPETLSPAQQQCRQLADRLHAFFNHLDQEEYIQEFQLGVPTQQYFSQLASKLLNNPPVVSRESDDLYTILKNMAHFFRIIGGKNIIIIKKILDREREDIEDVAADLFQWATGEGCSSDIFSFPAPEDKLYEYAGFFLNSIGGRSYLFRRDSRSRLLVNYYAIMLIDRANNEGINQHGIDIRPLLPISINETDSSNQLIYKEKYLDNLYELMERYQ